MPCLRLRLPSLCSRMKQCDHNRKSRGVPALILLTAISLRLTAAQPLATFECREQLDRDWPRTLVTYPKEFPPGAAREGELRLVDAAGNGKPVQVWRVKNHSDGSLQSARATPSTPTRAPDDWSFADRSRLFTFVIVSPNSRPGYGLARRQARAPISIANRRQELCRER